MSFHCVLCDHQREHHWVSEDEKLREAGVCEYHEYIISWLTNYVHENCPNGSVERFRAHCGYCRKQISGKPVLFHYYTGENGRPFSRQEFSLNRFSRPVLFDFYNGVGGWESAGKLAPKILEKSYRNASGESKVLRFGNLRARKNNFDDFIKSHSYTHPYPHLEDLYCIVRIYNRSFDGLWIYFFHTDNQSPDELLSERKLELLWVGERKWTRVSEWNVKDPWGLPNPNIRPHICKDCEENEGEVLSTQSIDTETPSPPTCLVCQKSQDVEAFDDSRFFCNECKHEINEEGSCVLDSCYTCRYKFTYCKNCNRRGHPSMHCRRRRYDKVPKPQRTRWSVLFEDLEEWK